MDYQKIFINKINRILNNVDCLLLDRSCNNTDNGYAKEVLKKLHDAFVCVYGTDDLAEGELEFVELPAVIRGTNSGHIALGLVALDLESSGEHWGTIFLTPHGVLEQGGENLSAHKTEYINRMFIPYDYWYTPKIEGDIHVDFDKIPDTAADILNACGVDHSELSENNHGMEMK